MAEIGVMKKLTIGGSTYTIDSGVTSVQVQATSPVQSSTSAAQTSTLNTTISLADGYGDTKNPYASKTKNYVLAAPSNANGVPSFRALVAADIPDLSGTYLTSHQNIKTLHSKTLTGTGDVTLTYSDVGAAASSHAHGNITNGGDITATAPTIASGDQIIINDNSASKITNGPTFDGSTTTKALTPKGTWETFLQSYTESYTGTITEVKTTAGAHTTIDVTSGKAEFNVPTATSHLTNDSGFITSYTDEKLKIAAVTSGTTYYPIVAANSTAAANRQYDATGIAYTGTNGTANGTNGNALLTLGNSTASTTANWKKGTVRLYGTTAYYTDLVSGAPSANRTITFPNATGTVALTSDIPDVSSFVTSSGVTSIATTSPISGGTITSTGTISHATSGVGSAVTTAGFYKFKYDTYGHVTGVTSVAASDITGLVTIPTVPSNIVNTITTTAGAHTAITSQKGDVSFNVPTKTSHLTNDSGFITSDSDENVKSTAVTAATTNYIVGSTTSTTTTGGLSKHASAVLYTTADSGTSGYTQLRLGNTTATSSVGGKEGQIRLYGTNATYYVDLKAGAVASSNKTITFPNKTGTVALTTDIPDVSSFITDAGVTKITTTAGTHTAITNSTGAVSFNVPTKTSHLTNDSGFITSDTNTTYALSNALSSHKFTETLTAGGSGSGTSTATMEFAAGTGITLTDDTTNKKITIACSVTNSDEKVKLTSNTGSTAVPLVLGPTSISSGSTYNCLYNTNLKYTPSTGNLQTTQLNGVAVGSSPKFTDTVTTVTSSGSGNVVTGMSASNGAITYTLGTVSGGGSYTATSPIDITNSVISHEDSGVTAGTYDGGFDNKTYFCIPSFTVDSKGHITSASETATTISLFSLGSPTTPGLVYNTTAFKWPFFNSSIYAAYDTSIIPPATSATVTITPPSMYFTTVMDVIAIDDTTKERVLVDWSFTPFMANSSSSITVTVSIAQAYTNTIRISVMCKQYMSM